MLITGFTSIQIFVFGFSTEEINTSLKKKVLQLFLEEQCNLVIDQDDSMSKLWQFPRYKGLVSDKSRHRID